MKRIVLLFAAVMLMCILVACGNENYCKTLEQEDYSPITNKLEELAIESNEEYEYKAWLKKTPKAVEKKPENVTMTLPENYVNSDRTQDEWTQLAKEMGCESITLNDDSSVSYVMGKDRKESWMKEIKQYINDTIISLAYSLELSPYKPFTANDDYSKVVIITCDNNKDFSIDGGYKVYDVIQLSKLYNTYNQHPIDNVEVDFGYLDNTVYEQYLRQYSNYLSAKADYETALKEYEQAEKTYDNDMKAYKTALDKAKKKNSEVLDKYENTKAKYQGKTLATWVSDYFGNYTLTDKDGEQVFRAWVQDGNFWYYIDDDGYMVTNQMLNIEGIHYLFGASGKIISGDNDKYYDGKETTSSDPTRMMSIVPVKPVLEEPVEPTKPVKPFEPEEPVEPQPEIFCSVMSSELFAGKGAN